MQLFKMLFCPLLLVLSIDVNAAEVVLCEVGSDINNDTGKIVYEMDNDNRVIEHLYQDSYVNGKLTGRIEIKADNLKEGIVLNRKDKYITVRMYSENYDNQRGGVLYLDTLYNGLNGERREYDMEVAFEMSGVVLIKNKQQFNKMKFIAKKSKVLGVIGIERVEFIAE